MRTPSKCVRISMVRVLKRVDAACVASIYGRGVEDKCCGVRLEEDKVEDMYIWHLDHTHMFKSIIVECSTITIHQISPV